MIADIKLTVTKRSIAPPWCDGVGVDIAARMGQEDATEGNGHMPADWIKGNPAYLASYDAGYAGGLAIVAKLNGVAQSEGEFMAEMLDGLRAGVVASMIRLTEDQLSEIERERPGEDYCTRPWEW